MISVGTPYEAPLCNLLTLVDDGNLTVRLPPSVVLCRQGADLEIYTPLFF